MLGFLVATWEKREHSNTYRNISTGQANRRTHRIGAKQCPTCASRKSPAPKHRGPLRSITAGYPMQVVAMDIVGPLPKTKEGNVYLLVITDHFSKWVEAYPIPNQEAITAAQKLVDKFLSTPEQLHADTGRQFEAGVILEVCKILRIKKTRTTPYHPQGDGLVEHLTVGYDISSFEGATIGLGHTG